MLIFCPLLLKINEVAIANGIIQRARVSLIVVAIFRASSPVSYTHLDVYKRQVVIYIGRKRNDKENSISLQYGNHAKEIL